jgi:hypothetical protein
MGDIDLDFDQSAFEAEDRRGGDARQHSPSVGPGASREASHRASPRGDKRQADVTTGLGDLWIVVLDGRSQAAHRTKSPNYTVSV